MESADDAWEAIFALAGNVNHPPDSLPKSVKGGSSCREQKKRRRSSVNKSSASGLKRHAATACDSTVNDDAAFQDYLIQRTSSTIVWPTWMSLGGGFNPRRCSHWLVDDSAATGRTDVEAYSKCSTCHQSALHHVSRATKSRIDCLTPTQEVFLALRNLRCVAVLLALHVAHRIPYDVPETMVDHLHEEWKHSIRRLQSSFNSIPESLRLAYQHVNPRILRSTSTDAALEPVVKVIISLDNAYFRLYYSLLSQDLPFVDGDAVIPHPVSYFGQVAVDIDCYQQLAQMRHMFPSLSVHPVCNEKMYRQLFDRFPLSERGDTLRFEHENLPESESALSLLHGLRFLETIAIFQTWSTRDSTRRQVVASCRAVMDRHETPAPVILMSWRDSCRDFLCHLYCYATLPHATLDKLRRVLVQRKVNTVFELGAGTGYLAHLLRELLYGDGILVDAADLYPTSLSTSAASPARNEYHGSTPPFFDVKGASELVIDERDHSQTALLLCYPPPESSFAFDAARRFTARNGQVIMFIGEFKGLTGDSKFERLLQREFDCVDRLPCLCWGTDASTVTVWAARSPSSSGASSSLLLPCSFCGNAESVKRCRLLRCLSYCSRRCFDGHALHREAALKLVMVDMGGSSGLDFDSNHHFSDLTRNRR